jgi:hypothetical protein
MVSTALAIALLLVVFGLALWAAVDAIEKGQTGPQFGLKWKQDDK